jgi:3-phosphoshikimate 1-carboxyvinyltransferase
MAEQKVIRPARNVSGVIRLPGDKSISHRYAMLAAIAEGATRLGNFSTGADCASTLDCLRALGVEWELSESVVTIQGRRRQLQAPTVPLDCGNSGSTMRMLTGILAGQDFSSELVGDPSLSRRPMARVIAPLQAMGAEISAADGTHAPLRITGRNLDAINYKMPVASAQVKSAVLFAGLFAQGETRVEEPVRTRDHGELALRAFGVEVGQRSDGISIVGGQRLQGMEATVPGDLSSAAFFLCAAALFPESQLILNDLGLNPTRSSLLDLLAGMGLRISITQVEEHHGELTGTVQVEGGELRGAVIQSPFTEKLIDEIPVLAAIAPYTETGIEIRDARELRVKESDRIAALAANLRAMGADVEERQDGLKVPGKQSLHGTEIDSFGDHRIAMAFAVAALRAEGETVIKGAGAAVVSFPGFFEVLEGVVQR